MNVITITGRLGKDAEVRQAGNSTVCTINVANDVGYGDKKQTNWYRCNLWGKRAEGGLVPYLKKGTQVAISGEHSVKEYTDKDGNTRYSNDIRISEIDLIGGKPESPAQPQPAAQPIGGGAISDDIPFMPLWWMS